jgi:multidrug resistance efflux pump
MSKPKKNYFIIEYCSEIVDANTKAEAIAIAKHRIKDRVVEVDEENTCQVEDEDLLKEIEEDERKADEEEARATAKPKK